MNSEANDKNRKNYSKTIATAGIGFLLIAAALTFSFANYGQQLASAQQYGQSLANATGGTANASSGLANATGGMANASSGLANATGGMANASSGLANATGGMANASSGLANATGRHRLMQLEVA